MHTIKRAVLLQLMDSKDWTQANLARKTQISTRTLTKICSGSSDEPKVRWSNIEKIAKFLGVAPEVLTGEQDLPTQHKAADG
jgi:transcriptional regulator with XRE-family HTH domain